jgi:hypothetical protein
VAALATGYEFGINLLRSNALIERGCAIQADLYSAASSVGVRSSKRVWLGRWIRRTGGMGRTIDTPSPRSTQPKKKFCVVPTDTHAAASAGFSKGGAMSGVLIASFGIAPPEPEPVSADATVDDAVSDSGSDGGRIEEDDEDDDAMYRCPHRGLHALQPPSTRGVRRAARASATTAEKRLASAAASPSTAAAASPSASASASRARRDPAGPRPAPALPANGPREAAIGLGRASGTTYNKAASIHEVERVVEISVRFVVEGETTDDHHGVPRVTPTPAPPAMTRPTGPFGVIHGAGPVGVPAAEEPIGVVGGAGPVGEPEAEEPIRPQPRTRALPVLSRGPIATSAAERRI